MITSFFRTLAPGIACLCLAQASETERTYLSGTDKDHTVDWKFKCTSGANSGEWTTLPVPSHWDIHGFGSLGYKKDTEEGKEERGLYEHEFEAPAKWKGQRTFLVFEGVMTDTTAKLNGGLLGPVHQGGFYRFKYEVTDHLKYGEPNKLEVEVARHSSNESVNKAERLADYWVFAGIYRPVYLETVPQEFIERVAINARHEGDFAMDVFTEGVDEVDTIEAQITELDGKPVGEPFSTKVKEAPTRLETQIDSPRNWTAEAPNLYQVVVSLKRGDELIHTITQHFGFRTIEVRKRDGIYVNGQRVILKGINRHSFWPDSGRCLSDAVHRLDIETIKDMNMNAVRMSHYPPDQGFLDLCDELGLYVLDELAGWHNHYDKEVGPKLVEAMVTRDVNHPCILFWDNGNEGGTDPEFDAVFQEFDPQKRPVLHPWSPAAGINTGHYLAYDTAKVALEGRPMYYQPKANDEVLNPALPDGWIYMPTEMMHGLYDGGGGASLKSYWDLMTASPLLGGGFIWVFCDEGVRNPNTGQLDTAGNQAPDGMVGPYREREGSFYAIKEIWSPIQLVRDDEGSITIENHYDFTNAKQCQFDWQLRRFRGPGDVEAGFDVLAKGTATAPSITPGESGFLDLKLPTEDIGADALALRVTDPSGRELWTWVWPLREFGWTQHKALGTGDFEVTSNQDSIILVAGPRQFVFGRGTGHLTEVRIGDKTIPLSGGLRPAHGEARLKEIQTGQVDFAMGWRGFTASYDGDLSEVTWKISPDGSLHCSYRYTAEGEMPFHGVALDFPEELVLGKRWLGNGPFRVWKNRQEGVTLGVWENRMNHTITGHTGWEYPDFMGCFSGVRWMQLDTLEGLITLVPGNEEVFVQVLTPDSPPESLVGQTKINLPEAGLALLHGIPPVGTKFKAADQGGPQGQPNQTEGEISGSFRLYFGALE